MNKCNVCTALSSFGCRVSRDVPMSRYTTFMTGGECAVLCECFDSISAAKAYCFLREYNQKFIVIGRGSKILVSDSGYDGVILRFYGDGAMYREGNTIIVSGGVPAKAAASFALSHNLGGAEFIGSIPGSMGGLTRMNAGCYGGEMKDIVSSVKGIIDGNAFEYSNADCRFAYRSSIFDGREALICEVSLRLIPTDGEEILSKTEEIRRKRKESQPLEYPSAGSVFKRQEGVIPAMLIEKANLKGLLAGGAQISLKHSGFIVNTGGATSSQIYFLIKKIKEEIFKINGINLAEEIIYIGEFT